MKYLIAIILTVGCSSPQIRKPIKGIVCNKEIQRRTFNPDSYYIVVRTNSGKKVYDGNASEYLRFDIGDSITIAFDETDNSYLK